MRQLIKIKIRKNIRVKYLQTNLKPKNFQWKDIILSRLKIGGKNIGRKVKLSNPKSI